MIADTFFYLSEPIWTAIVGGIVSCILAWMKFSADAAARNAEINARKAAIKVDEVRAELKVISDKADLKTDAISDVLNDVHTLTNSQHGLVLQSNATLARWKADKTKDHQDWSVFEAAAVKAESDLADHKAKQSIVDYRKESP